MCIVGTPDHYLSRGAHIFIAIAAAVLYGFGCWVFDERFPFSRFELYSGSAKRDRSAVIVFLVDGQPSNVWDYHRFSGFCPDQFLTPDVPTGLQWLSHEMARWVEEHSEADADGPVQVSVGYRIFSVSDTASIEEELQVLQHGKAWPR